MCNCHSNTGNVNSKALQAALATLQRAGQLKQVGDQFYLPANETVICDTALDFLDKQGFVTTLQVKNHLRSQGYFVKQSDVSDEMSNMVDNGEILFTNVWTRGKQHRLFFAEGTPEPIAIAAYQTTV